MFQEDLSVIRSCLKVHTYLDSASQKANIDFYCWINMRDVIFVVMQFKKAMSKAKSFTAAEWFGFLFTTFAIILFAVAVILNRSYYSTSLKSINADLLEDFRGVAEGLKSVITLKETEILQADLLQPSSPALDTEIYAFTIIDVGNTWRTEYHKAYVQNITDIGGLLASNNFAQAGMLMELCLNSAPPLSTTALPGDSDLMIVPTFLVPLFSSFSDDSLCQDAFSQGLKALENGKLSNAEKHFSISAQIAPKSAISRLISAWSYVYTLPENNEEALRILYYMLYVATNAPGEPLDKYTYSAIEDLLKNRFNDYEKHKQKSRDLWDLAEEITDQIDLEDPPVRMLVNGMIISAIKDPKLFTFRIDWLKYLPNTPNIRLQKLRSPKNTTLDFPLDFLPGYVLSMSQKTFEIESRAITRQYLVTNTLLGVLLLLIVLFALGSVRLIREENNLARLRSRFVATVSHELRTPLSLIQLYSETLNEGRIDAGKRRGYLQTIVAETQRLTGLVNNVIDFSRLEIGTKKLNYSDSNISELAWNVIQEFKYRLNLEGFRINVHIAPDLKARIDPQAFCRILFNLLDNAIKYSEKEKYIALRLSQEVDKAVLEVTDHGIGIPVDARPFVYMDYYRVDDPRVASQRGSGIGLSVVKQLLDVMNASVEIHDAEPTGTTFIVQIPTNREQDKQSKES